MPNTTFSMTSQRLWRGDDVNDEGNMRPGDMSADRCGICLTALPCRCVGFCGGRKPSLSAPELTEPAPLLALDTARFSKPGKQVTQRSQPRTFAMKFLFKERNDDMV
ncbi:hypothetical protein ElyMa_003506800 [Elysia marginata]|uniref:Uncharacterized protein n=1 Tax=Elysia marginata TaxID=1093978 RepID=A0AAV4EFJ2_9GAST|nr:hypothetical protein ElyMa_003506800 [Elysia marginata]